MLQAEADAYIAERKRFAAVVAMPLPPGVDATYELTGAVTRTPFLLDVWRGTLKLSKVKYQNRVRIAVVLVRIDVNSSPHTNPDGQKIEGTHIHVFREGYDDKWASPLDPRIFQDTGNIAQLLHEFCNYCNIDDGNVTAQVGML